MKGLNIPIGGDISGLNNALSQAEGRIDAFVSKVNKIGEVGDALSSLGTKLTTSITLPITALAAASIKAYGDIQSLEKGLEAVMGSAAAASAEFVKLKEVAKLPGLGMKEAVQGSINLQAIGISADKSRNILQQFGNAVATVGKGRVEFERAIYGVQQLANTDFPLGEDLNIIKDAIPQVSSLLKEAFGSSRSDELAKMGISSKQVLNTILEGLGKLPRVSGGIKGAFENMSDSIQTSLARLGKVIDKNINISNIIDKVTNALDKLITGFENLDPAFQQLILGTAAAAAAIGPLLVAVGSVISMAPTLLSVLGGIKIAMLALTGPIGIATLAIGGLVTAYLLLRDNTKTAADYQKEWTSALNKANSEAKTQISALDGVWKKTQDLNLSTNERKTAIDELRKMFPAYFKDISNEAILNGTATESYNQLRTSIVNASRARVAQAELDKRNEERLQKELKLRESLGELYKQYYNPKSVQIAGSGGAVGANLSVTYDEKQVKENAKNAIKAALQAYAESLKEYDKADKPLLDFINKGAGDIEKVFGQLGETADKLGGKFAKGTEGWYEEEIKRLETLKDTAIVGSKEWNNLNSIIEKYQKLLNPDKLKIQLPDIEPVTGGKKGLYALGKIFGDPVEYQNYLNSLIDTTALGFTGLAKTIDDGVKLLGTKQAYLDEAKIQFQQALINLIPETITSSISDTFSAIGEAIGSGGNIIQAFGQSVIGAMGGFLKNLGKLMIQYGTAGLAYAILSKMLTNPITAAPAAIAMIAAGAALSLAGGAISGALKGGSSGGSVGNSTGANYGSSQSYSSSYSSGSGFSGEVVFRISGNDLVGVLSRNQDKNKRLNAGN